MAALAIPSLISAGTSLIGGILGSGAAKKAAAAQVAASQQAQGKVSEAVAGAQAGEGQSVGIANDQITGGVSNANRTLADVFSGQQANLQPYLSAGAQGVSSLADLYKNGGSQFSFNPTDLQNEPGYQFQLQQGQQSIARQAAANSAAGSGGTLASLLKYGQGLAGTTYQDAYNRALSTFQTNRTNTLQGLSTLAGIGQNATGQYNSAAQNFGNNTSSNLVNGGLQTSANTLRASEYGGNAGLEGSRTLADLITGAGNAQAAGTIGSANAWSGALGGVGNAAQSYAQNTTLSNLYNSGGTPAYSGPTAAQAAGALWTTPQAAPPTPSTGYGVTAPPSAGGVPAWMTPQIPPPSVYAGGY